MTRKWLTKSRITSKPAEPGPTIIPARNSVTAILPFRSVSPVSAREERCSDAAPTGCKPPK